LIITGAEADLSAGVEANNLSSKKRPEAILMTMKRGIPINNSAFFKTDDTPPDDEDSEK
jgi:hypothetical protein